MSIFIVSDSRQRMERIGQTVTTQSDTWRVVMTIGEYQSWLFFHLFLDLNPNVTLETNTGGLFLLSLSISLLIPVSVSITMRSIFVFISMSPLSISVSTFLVIFTSRFTGFFLVFMFVLRPVRDRINLLQLSFQT